MRWTNLPTPLEAAPGLIRWTPVDGATAYQVWYVEPDKIFKTQTTVADEREYYTFHQGTKWTATLHWRIRAIRALYGNVRNGLPSVSYGPWSPVYTSTNTPFVGGALSTVETISDTTSTAAAPAAHHVMPAFTFSGDTGLNGIDEELYRVYVATDRDCVNIVFRGAIVGGPAYAPRWNGTLALPNDIAQLAGSHDVPGAGLRGVHVDGGRHSGCRKRSSGVGREHDFERRGRLALERRHRYACGGDEGRGTGTEVPAGRRSPWTRRTSGLRSTSGTPTGRRAVTTGRSFL